MPKIDRDPGMRGQVASVVEALLDKGLSPQQAGFLISLAEVNSDGKLVCPLDLTRLSDVQWSKLIARYPELETDFLNYAWRGGEVKIDWDANKS